MREVVRDEATKWLTDMEKGVGVELHLAASVGKRLITVDEDVYANIAKYSKFAHKSKRVEAAGIPDDA